MPRYVATTPITALVYADSARAAETLRRLVEELASTGASVVGYIQRDVVKPGRSRCDMVLENIATGHQLAISEDRGPGARGCQLDVDCLTAAMVDLRNGLPEVVDVLVLNKFGKSEAEGGGFRPVIVDALDRGIPVILGVPWRNIEPWRAFAGEFAREVLLDDIERAKPETVLERFGLSAPPQADTVTAIHSFSVA